MNKKKLFGIIIICLVIILLAALSVLASNGNLAGITWLSFDYDLRI